MKFKIVKSQRKTFFMAIFFVMCFGVVQAQQSITVKGVVTGGGDTLPQVSILEKGTSNGVVSDFDGNYSIKVKSNSTLIFSYIGFAVKEVKVNGNKTLNVTLIEDVSQLDEIVVVGYGTQKKKEVTGAVANVSGEEISKTPTGDLTTALQGKIAGVNIQAPNGSPGENANILIRGLSSLSEGGSEPLYVVDGIPYQGNPNISPEQIESIDVLKDGASASIYGVRAAAGVILITTKQGKEGDARVSFNSYVGIQNITSGTPLVNTQQQFYLNELTNVANDRIRSPLFTSQNAFNNDSDYVAAITNDNAVVENYALNISGGKQGITLNMNSNLFRQDGVLIASSFERFSNRLTGNFKKGKFKAFASFNITQEKREREPFNIYERAISANPYSRDINDLLQSGDFEDEESESTAGFVRDFLNTNEIETNRTNMAIRLEYEILKGLTYRISLGKNKTDQFRKAFSPQVLNYSTNNGVRQLNLASSRLNATLTEDKTNEDRQSIEHIISYNTKIGKHSIGLLGVYSREQLSIQDSRVNGLFSQDAPNNLLQQLAGAESVTSSGLLLESSLTGTLARLQYSYDEKYLLSGSYRRDGSSKFKKENRYGDFFGVSAGWNIHEEDFMSDVRSFISNFKLRVSYAELGNQNTGFGLVGFYPTSSTVETGVNFIFGNPQSLTPGLVERRIVNENLKWEVAVSRNIGVDIGLFKNKLQLNLDVYKNTQKDMLLRQTLPGSAGTTTPQGSNLFGVVLVNAGSMENQGVEFSATYKNRTKGGLRYNFNYTFTSNKNTITDLNGIDRGFGGGTPFVLGANNVDNTTFFAVGHEAASFFLLENQGVIKTDEELIAYTDGLSPDNAINFQKGDLKFKDQNGDGLIDDKDLVYSGSGQSDFELAFNVDLKYKNFDFSALAYFSYGAELYNGSKLYAYQRQKHTDLLYMWTEQNPTSDIPTFRNANSENLRARTDYFLEDGTYLRIRNITLGYTVPNSKKYKIDKLRFYFSSLNPFTFTKYDGYDPEVGGNQIQLRGVDRGNYPVARQFNLGVQVNF